MSDKERPERMTNGGESEERAHSRLITLGLSFTLFTLTPHHLPLPAGGRQGEVRGKIESDVRQPFIPAVCLVRRLPHDHRLCERDGYSVRQ